MNESDSSVIKFNPMAIHPKMVCSFTLKCQGLKWLLTLATNFTSIFWSIVLIPLKIFILCFLVIRLFKPVLTARTQSFIIFWSILLLIWTPYSFSFKFIYQHNKGYACSTGYTVIRKFFVAARRLTQSRNAKLKHERSCGSTDKLRWNQFLFSTGV